MSMPSSSDDVATRHGISPGLQQLLDDDPLLARERAVVRARELLLRELVDAEREPLREPAVVDEDDRRAVLPDELEDRRVDRGPDRPARLLHADAHLHAVGERRHGELRRSTRARACPRRGTTTCEVELLPDPCVDELDLASGAGDEPADLLERPLRRRETDALERRLDELLETLEREREVRAALRPRDGVHLVEDHRLDTAQRLARLRGEEQEERLGRGDQDVRRRAQHPAPLLGRRVARAHADRELRAEPRERAAQVPLDVVVERLERGDVEQPESLTRRLVQPVDPEQERRERLPRAGRRLDEHVPARRDRRPAERLRGRRTGERALEPRPRLRARRRRARPFAQGIRPTSTLEACPRRSTSPTRTRRTSSSRTIRSRS